MIKSIIQFFDKGDRDGAGKPGSEENQNELDRMVKMRNRITHNKLKALQAADSACVGDEVCLGDDSSEQNLISRAKNAELVSGRGSKRLIQSEINKPSISLLSGLAERVSHLDGAH